MATSSRSTRAHADGGTETAHVLSDFKAAVNMTPAQLERWLQTEESRTVGFKGAPGKESVGHASGRRIVRLLGKDRDALTAGDLAHMRKVVGYVHRHLAQRPSGNVRDTPWRQSLMNWGHDPLKRR
ncbi:DUF3140 domain-containing protein [Xenophilus aerolatus]|nr:DUF3140 domain-containing protein [Xenophilus aerolatus]